MSTVMGTRRDRYRLLSVPDHLRAHDDDLDAGEAARVKIDERVSEELAALRRALYTAAIGFVIGFPALAFAIVFAVSKIAGG